MKLLADALGGIAHIVAMYYFFSCFFTSFKVKKELAIAVYVLNGIYGMVYPMITTTVPQRMICTSIYFLIPLCIYQGKWSTKTMLFATYWAVLSCSEYLVYAILLGVLGDFALFYQSYEYN